MTKPIPAKAEVALEYPDKLYIGAFERTSRFDAHLDETGISLTLERTGAADERKSVHMHFHFALFAVICAISLRRYRRCRRPTWSTAPNSETPLAPFVVRSGQKVRRPIRCGTPEVRLGLLAGEATRSIISPRQRCSKDRESKCNGEDRNGRCDRHSRAPWIQLTTCSLLLLDALT